MQNKSSNDSFGGDSSAVNSKFFQSKESADKTG